MLLRFNAIFLPLVIVCAAFQIPIRSINTRRAIVPLVVAALIVCPTDWLDRFTRSAQSGRAYPAMGVEYLESGGMVAVGHRNR